MSESNLIDFAAKRKQNIEQKRRNFERIMFKDFLGCYTIIDNNDTGHPVDIVDISKDGLQFQVFERDSKRFQEGMEIELRFYFTKQNYIPAVVQIRHSYDFDDSMSGKAHQRFGCTFDKSLPSFKAMESFLRFIYDFAEHSSTDKGDGKVYFL